MTDSFATAHRTHTCGELRKAHVGQSVTLAGAVDALVDDASFTLRDAFGTTLVRLGAAALALLKEGRDRPLGFGKPMKLGAGAGRAEQLKAPEAAGDKVIQRLTPESTVRVKGKVLPRPAADAAAPTGEVLVEASELETFTKAKAPLLFDFRSDAIPAKDRIRHRYLALRSRKVHEIFKFRTDLLAGLRRFLAGRGFDEIESPILANRWTPEQTEPFFAIRGLREVFVLPGERPIHQPLLMAAGFDRTYEIARRFRRKSSYGPFQQPEFTVLDMALAFVSERDLHRFEDELLAHVWQQALGEELETPVPEATYEEALVRYGTDCPDTRYGLELQDVTRVAAQAKSGETRKLLTEGGAIRALRVEGGAERLPEADLAALGRLASGARATGVAWIAPAGDAVRSALLESGDAAGPGSDTFPVSEKGPLDESLARDIVKAVEAKPGDVVLVVLARQRGAAAAVSAALRRAVAEKLGSALERRKRGLVRITRPPYWRFDHAKNEWVLRGDPLTRPVEEELEGDRYQMHGLGHYLVLDGVNVGGGAIRNHHLPTQQALFKAAGYGPKDIDERFEQVIRAFRFGVPPHGRAAIGIDRLVTLLRGLPSIDEVIPLPKWPDGTDPLARSPFPIEPSVVRGYFGV